MLKNHVLARVDTLKSLWNETVYFEMNFIKQIIYIKYNVIAILISRYQNFAIFSSPENSHLWYRWCIHTWVHLSYGAALGTHTQVGPRQSSPTAFVNSIENSTILEIKIQKSQDFAIYLEIKVFRQRIYFQFNFLLKMHKKF